MSIRSLKPKVNGRSWHHQVPIVLSGKALERRFICAARQNRVGELDDLARTVGALSEKTFALATSRLHKSDTFVTRSKTVQIVGCVWRKVYGQTLSVKAALHIGKKLLNEHVDEIIAGRTEARAASEERNQAMSQLFSLMVPELRVTAHAMLLSYLSERSQYERMVIRLRPGEERLPKEGLREASRHRSRQVEQGGIEFLDSSAIRAASFDAIDVVHAPAPSMA
jgi:hypothetical protein